jgi:hypothetical protein
MPHLPSSLGALGTDAFDRALKEELAALGADALPLDTCLAQGGLVAEDRLTLSVLRKTDDESTSMCTSACSSERSWADAAAAMSHSPRTAIAKSSFESTRKRLRPALGEGTGRRQHPRGLLLRAADRPWKADGRACALRR